jgi:hypothetical protein
MPLLLASLPSFGAHDGVSYNKVIRSLLSLLSSPSAAPFVLRSLHILWLKHQPRKMWPTYVKVLDECTDVYKLRQKYAQPNVVCSIYHVVRNFSLF